MPTTYAHNLFGKIVYQRSDKEIQELIKEYRTAYMIGLHGPDILFYVKPFCSNRVNRMGQFLHQQQAAEFFRKGRSLYQETKNQELLAYLLGFICHFMLDSSCHPYIETYIEKTGATHDEIETEFDRALMEQTGKNPFLFRPAGVIRIENHCLDTIASVLDGISREDVKKGLLGMKFYTGVTVCRTPLKRNLMLGAARILGISSMVQGRIMKKDPVERCLESSGELKRLFKLAVPETVTVLNEFYRNIGETGELNPRFNRNYN